jgi:O-methyltransferase
MAFTLLRPTANHEKAETSRIKGKIRAQLPRGILLLWRFFRTGDWAHVLAFLFAKRSPVPPFARFRLIRRMYAISYQVPCEHTQAEMLSFIRAILSISSSVKGCVVEAGCFKGGSTAKLSLAARLAGRDLVAFDSFEGIPANSEPHAENIWGGRVRFSHGDYCGSLEEVKLNVTRLGDVQVCCFMKGWFDVTMPRFQSPVAAVYLDVDLASSTRICLRYLWPLLEPGGVLYSQDGHLPLVLKAYHDQRFWEDEIRCPPPEIHGCGKGKVIWMRKPSSVDLR